MKSIRCSFYLVCLALYAFCLLPLSATTTKIVGKIPDEITVNNRGTAVYDIPVNLPSGIAGFQPELSITYDSGAGNGLLGMGFDLGGLSSISRSATTLEQDGFIDGVDFDYNDRFHLDSQRLVCTNGTYGVAGSEYRTEIESFNRIKAYGTSVVGPDYFVVETKSGLTKTYGQSSSCAHIYNQSGDPADGAKTVWLLEKVQDSSGNEINYSYASDPLSDRLYLSEISYGASQHLLKAVIVYENRNDHLPLFIKGNSYATTMRVKEVEIYSGILHLATYECVYDVSPHRPVSRLRELVYRDEPTQKIMRTTFDWLDESALSTNGFEAKEDWLNYSGSDPLDVAVKYQHRPLTGGYTADHAQRTIRRGLVDMNGDGFPDRVEYQNHLQSGAPGMWVHLNNGDGFDAPTLWYQSSREEQNCIQWKHDQNVGSSESGMSSAFANMQSMLLDMNGDGLPDKLDHMDYGAVDTPGIWVAINNGSGFDPKANWLPSATDEAHAFITQRRDRGTQRDLIDVNGDGLPDRVEYRNHELNDAAGFWVRLNNGTGFEAAVLWYQGAVEEQNYVSWDFPSPDDLDRGSLFNTLIDMNGDRIPEKIDYIDPTSASVLGMWICPGEGNGFGTAVDWLQVAITSVPFGKDMDHSAARSVDGLNDVTQADLVDLNGDGLPDRITMEHPVTGAKGTWVALNTGSGFDAFSLWAPDLTISGSTIDKLNSSGWNSAFRTKVQLLDMNGDGLLDKLLNEHPDSRANGVWVMINNGAGFESPINWLPSPVTSSTYGGITLTSAPGVLFDLLDVNGDGLPDWVNNSNICDSNADYGFWVYINNGKGFSAAVDWSQHFGAFGTALSPYERFLVERKQTLWSDDLDGTVYAKFLDINGDGFPDRVTGEEFPYSGGWGMWVGLSQMKPTKLVTITDNLGAVTEIEYKPLTDPSVYTVGVRDQMPPIVSVLDTRYIVSALSIDVGFPTLARTEYTYAEARMHMDGRGFLGFRVFESYDHQTRLTHTEIVRQDFPYTGMSVSQTVYSGDGQMIARTVNALNLKGTNPYVVNENGQNVTYYHTVFPYVETTEAWSADFDNTPDFSNYTEVQLSDHLETTAHQHIITDYDYDAHGSPISESVDYGDGFTQETTTLYAYDNVAAWFLGRASSVTVRTNAPGQTEAVRSSAFTYNNNGLLWTETNEPGDPLSVTTTYTRDSQGRVISTTVDPADGPAFVSVSHFQLDATGRFYEKSINALGHSETTQYDSAWGWVVNLNDVNNRVTIYEYDPLGRTARIEFPSGDWREYAYAFDTTRQVDPYSSPPGGLALQSAYRLTESGPQTPAQKVWYDRSGKEISTATESFDGTWSYTDYYADISGNIVYTSLPYFSGDSIHWNVATLDSRRRKVIEFRPNGFATFVLYEGRLVTKQTLELGQPLKIERVRTNARGELESTSVENDSGDEVILSYTYDAIGNLVQTEDSEGNLITMSYDVRGNKTGMDDPDMGNWTYTYNALGQLVSQTDAVGNLTTMSYDLLGRLTSEAFATPSSQITTHEFYYDGTGEFDEIGALRYESSSNGTCRAHYYDDLGREFLTIEKIEGRWFYRQQDYDAFSRPTRLTHYWRPPSFDDGQNNFHIAWYSFAQEQIYNSRGYVEEVRDDQGQVWWSTPAYNAAGQLTSYFSANGLLTNQTFDPLSNELTGISIKNGGVALIEQSYDYNALGHLTQRRDQLRSLVEDFTYDSQQRLDTISLAGNLTLDMTYDDLGNITDRTDLSGGYGYGSANGPHRVTSAGGRSFGYNANGAISSVSGNVNGLINWNAFHKPDSIEYEGQSSRFTYGTSKQRVAQTRMQWNSVIADWDAMSRKTYVGSLFEQEQVWPSGSSGDLSDPASWSITSTRVYIATPAGVTGSWISDYDSNTVEKTCFHRDNIGSIIAETGADVNDLSTYAQLTGEFSFDAWGQARSASDWSTPTNPQREGTDRGYTGHEMLDSLGLIHMNGRIYDPALARFLSADPIIQAPDNMQSYNRYSYVWNNPLSMTDPSGFLTLHHEDGSREYILDEKTANRLKAVYLALKSGALRLGDSTESASDADSIGTEAESDQTKTNQQEAANQQQQHAQQQNGSQEPGTDKYDLYELKDFKVVYENPNFASGTGEYMRDPETGEKMFELKDFTVTSQSTFVIVYGDLDNGWFYDTFGSITGSTIKQKGRKYGAKLAQKKTKEGFNVVELDQKTHKEIMRQLLSADVTGWAFFGHGTWYETPEQKKTWWNPFDQTATGGLTLGGSQYDILPSDFRLKGGGYRSYNEVYLWSCGACSADWTRIVNQQGVLRGSSGTVPLGVGPEKLPLN